jgi:hypothetical protein
LHLLLLWLCCSTVTALVVNKIALALPLLPLLLTRDYSSFVFLFVRVFSCALLLYLYTTYLLTLCFLSLFFPSFLRLQDQLQPLGPSEAGREHIILVRSNISLLAAANSSSSSSSSSGGNSTANSTAPRTIPPGGVPVPYPVSLLSDVSMHGTSKLDLGFRQGLVALEANAEDGQLQVRNLV